MTSLLVGTFVVAGAHTLLWLPRALQMRRELIEAEAAEEKAVQAAGTFEVLEPEGPESEEPPSPRDPQPGPGE